MHHLNVHRRFYARLVCAKAGVTDPRVIAALAAVPREAFLGPGPWMVPVGSTTICTETDDPVVLYQDILVALDPARGINNGEPSLHALCLGAVLPQPGEVVIHVGAGTGYYTAILAHLVGEAGSIHAFEIDAALAGKATSNLAHVPSITVHHRSAVTADLPAAQVIYVSAGATHVPGPWLDALTDGGRLIVPLTSNEGPGCLLMVSRHSEENYAARILGPAYFIPCFGARDEEQSRRLAAALRSGSARTVASLRRHTDPDDSAWCVGDGWWLSTAEPRPNTGPDARMTP